jgi:hypothetical protein
LIGKDADADGIDAKAIRDGLKKEPKRQSGAERQPKRKKVRAAAA